MVFVQSHLHCFGRQLVISPGVWTSTSEPNVRHDAIACAKRLVLSPLSFLTHSKILASTVHTQHHHLSLCCQLRIRGRSMLGGVWRAHKKSFGRIVNVHFASCQSVHTVTNHPGLIVRVFTISTKSPNSSSMTLSANGISYPCIPSHAPKTCR